MKRFLTADQFEDLDESQQNLYKLEGDGRYKLVLEDDDEGDDKTPDASELERLRNKRKIESDHRKRAEAERDRLRDELEELKTSKTQEEQDDARKRNDVQALDTSYARKLADQKAQYEAKIAGLEGQLRTVLVDNVAQAVAAEISTAPELLTDAIKRRLRVEQGDGGPTTRVLDEAGELSAMTIDELKAEIAGNKRYAPIIIGSKASGGGGSSKQVDKGGAQKKLSDMTDEEANEWARTDPEGFARANPPQY